MFCPFCGGRLPDTAKFCSFCGAEVSFDIAAQSRPTPANTLPIGIGQPIPVQPSPAAVPGQTVLSENGDVASAAVPDLSAVSAPVPEQPTEKPKRSRKPSAKKMMNEGRRISPNIVLCQDGKYRWIYELNLLKNLTVFFLIWRIFFFIFLGIFTFVILIDALGGKGVEALLETLRVFSYFIIGMTVVSALGYLLYAAMMGGKYIVLFEMDERGVVHKQMPKQAKKAELIGAITALAGLATHNITTVGVGLNSSRTSMSSDFSKVRKVKAYRRRNLIKVNERLGHNQVYAEDVDFDFVYNFILSHVGQKQ